MSPEFIPIKEDVERFEENLNLLGVFEILMAVDKRINPHNYQPKINKNDD